MVTSYDVKGFLTTATIPAGASTGWDANGHPTTQYPSNCRISNPPIQIGEVLGSHMASASASDGQGATPAGSQVTTKSGVVVVGESGGTASLVTATATAASGAAVEEVRMSLGCVATLCTLGIAMAGAWILA